MKADIDCKSSAYAARFFRCCCVASYLRLTSAAQHVAYAVLITLLFPMVAEARTPRWVPAVPEALAHVQCGEGHLQLSGIECVDRMRPHEVRFAEIKMDLWLKRDKSVCEVFGSESSQRQLWSFAHDGAAPLRARASVAVQALLFRQACSLVDWKETIRGLLQIVQAGILPQHSRRLLAGTRQYQRDMLIFRHTGWNLSFVDDRK